MVQIPKRNWGEFRIHVMFILFIALCYVNIYYLDNKIIVVALFKIKILGFDKVKSEELDLCLVFQQKNIFTLGFLPNVNNTFHLSL